MNLYRRQTSKRFQKVSMTPTQWQLEALERGIAGVCDAGRTLQAHKVEMLTTRADACLAEKKMHWDKGDRVRNKPP